MFDSLNIYLHRIQSRAYHYTTTLDVQRPEHAYLKDVIGSTSGPEASYDDIFSGALTSYRQMLRSYLKSSDLVYTLLFS
jgi:hypothetical protein